MNIRRNTAPGSRRTAVAAALLTLLTAVAVLFGTGRPAQAQADLFAPAVYVNDRVVTNYEVDQYIRFLTLLRQPGDVEQIAIDRLIEDRLRFDAAQAAGVTVTPEEVETGMAEFAGRANLSTEQFLAAIAQGGVAPETFRAFVEAGVLWRSVVRTKFGPRVSISDAEIDRAIAARARQPGLRVRLGEIVVSSGTTEGRAAIQRLTDELSGKVVSEGAFAAEARQVSDSATAAGGGNLGWVPIANLPPQVAQILGGLRPNQVSPPINTGSAVAFFQLRGVESTDAPDQTALAIEWAEVPVADRAEAERLAGEVDTCDDLFGVLQGARRESLVRQTVAAGDVPADVAVELARLDDNEVSTSFARGGRPVLLMLCGRTFALPDATPTTAAAAAEGEGGEDFVDLGFGAEPSREQVRAALTNQRLAAFADGYLAELLADATIRRE